MVAAIVLVVTQLVLVLAGVQAWMSAVELVRELTA